MARYLHLKGTRLFGSDPGSRWWIPKPKPPPTGLGLLALAMRFGFERVALTLNRLGAGGCRSETGVNIGVGRCLPRFVAPRRAFVGGRE